MGTKDITFTLTIPGSAGQGYYWGRIDIKSANDNLTVPVGFRNIDITTEKGEWVISSDTDLFNQQFRAANLTITNNAKVTMDNVTIFIDSREDGLGLINVTGGSSLSMDHCTIASYNPSIYYNFTLHGRGTIRNSHLSGMWGVYQSPYPGGINIYSDNSEVSNSTIFRCYTNGIFSAETNGVLVADNYIHHNGGEGVLVWQVNGMTILRNNCSRNWWDGIGITGGGAVIADNAVHFNSYDGIWINNSSPYIANNIVTECGYWMKHQDAAGIKFQRDSRPVMENNVFSGNKYYGFYINASSPVVRNSSVNDSDTVDILIIPHKDVHCEPVFINSTYNSLSIPLSDPDSTITRKWFMQVSVVDEENTTVPGATIKVFDRKNNLVKDITTGASGDTGRFFATQYVRTLSKTDYHTPYRLDINKSTIRTTVPDTFLPESIEVNAVLPVPDLHVTGVSISTRPAFANETVTFSVHADNNASIPLKNVTLSCKLDNNIIPLAEFSYTELAAGEKLNVSISRLIAEPGEHKLTAEIYSRDDIIERETINNIFTYQFKLFVRPVAEYVYVKQSHTYAHEPILFTAVADAGDFNITGYQFSFSDGTTTAWLSENSTSHVFSNISFEQVSFRIRTESGFISNWSASLWLQIIERLPFAGFSFSPAVGDIFTDFQFSLSEDIAVNAGIISEYRWEFGDGAYSTEPAPNHEYIDDGMYNVTLSITYSTDGGTALFWKSLLVSNLAPEAEFFVSAKTVTPGEKITFNASTTVDRDDLLTELSFSWQFGDETTGSGLLVTHEYESANTYLVILTVTDNDNETSRFTMEISVRDITTGDNGTTDGDDGPDLTLAIIIVGVLAAILVVALAFMLKVKKEKTYDEELEE
jgi:parallel beta-helix repeat protein